MKDDLFNYLVATDSLDEFLGYEEKENNMRLFDNDKELEQRMNDLELEDWQKELVCEEKYDPESFEEDDSDNEDGYYCEKDE